MREGYKSEQLRNEAFAYVDLSKRQSQVYDIIEKWQPISNERIAEHLHVPQHHVTPRVLELRQLGIVEYCGEEVSKYSQRRISLWRINKEGKQLSLF